MSGLEHNYMTKDHRTVSFKLLVRGANGLSDVRKVRTLFEQVINKQYWENVEFLAGHTIVIDDKNITVEQIQEKIKNRAFMLV